MFMKNILLLVALLLVSLQACCGILERPAKYFEQQKDKNISIDKTDSLLRSPDFCNKLDCPNFQLVNQESDYELRSYSQSMWISTQIEGIGYDQAIRYGFMKIFQYIDGNNEKKQKIPMTTPVLTKIIPGQGPYCVNNFTISFFVPFYLQEKDKLPEPTDKSIYTQELPKADVFVRVYPGYSNEKLILQEAEKLSQALDAKKNSYEKSFFMSAGYDSPFKLLNRHNEVWILKKDQIQA